MKILTSFVISVIIGTAIAITSRNLGWGFLETLLLAFVAGAIQGIITATFFPDYNYVPVPVKKDDDSGRD